MLLAMTFTLCINEKKGSRYIALNGLEEKEEAGHRQTMTMTGTEVNDSVESADDKDDGD